MKLITRLLAAAAICWIGLAHAQQPTTTVVFQSDAGDYIGQGQNQTFSAPQWAFTASGSNHVLQLNFNNGSSTHWTTTFSAPAALAVGRYAGAMRYPFNSPRKPGMDVSGDGRGCNQLTGWFEVKEFVLNSQGVPVRAAIDFRQACESGATALYGSIRLNSSVPLNIPAFKAVADGPAELLAGDQAVLDGGQSFDQNASAVRSYSWVQTAGTPVTLDQPTNPYPAFIAPVVPAGGETLRFRLTYSDSAGATDTASTDILVHAPGDPVTYVRFTGDGNDYITGGRSYSFFSSNSDLVFASINNGTGSNGVEVRINGDSYWTLDFASPQNTPFKAGSYEGAMRYPFQDAASPGLSVYGDGRGCNTLTGRFDVLDAAFNLATQAPTRLDIQFEQHCEGGASRLTGELKYNGTASAPPPPPPQPDQPTPTALAGNDFTVRRGQFVKLDGSASFEINGTISSYHWMQISGPSVRLRNANSAKPTFFAPTFVKKSVLRFRLMVVDASGQTADDLIDVTVGTQQN